MCSAYASFLGRARGLRLALALLGAVASGGDAGAQTVFGVAGVPQSLGRARDYDATFALLRANGITAFFPTFQTVEQPAAASLGFETDFLPPCTPESPAFSALRRQGVGLVVAADAIYPRGAALPAAERDPLRALIACAGREHIHAVLSYDEPVHQGASEAEVERVYRRVKEVAADLPVLMVHAPMILDQPRYATAAGRNAYLAACARYSRHADVVGFDVYPIPRDIAKVTAPDGNGAAADHAAAIRSYTAWLRRAVPGKPLMMVLQGFSYVDQFEPAFLARIAGPSVIAAVSPPSPEETAEMVRLAVAGGAGTVFWWGPSLLRDAGSAPWPAILDAARTAR